MCPKVIRRTSYPEETYHELVERAAHQWCQWHDQLSRAIYYQTGKLNIWSDVPTDSLARRGLETLRQREKTVEVLSPDSGPPALSPIRRAGRRHALLRSLVRLFAQQSGRG